MSNDDIRKEVIAIVKQAGEMLKAFRSDGFSSHSKGSVDFATEADDTIDAFLQEELHKKFPQTQFLTEETAPKQYAEFSELDNLWIIDPIDGTTNFSRGSDHCAISVALVDKRKTRVGVVSLPFQQKTYWAECDSDTSYMNETPNHVSEVNSLQEALVCCDWSWNMEKRTITHQALGRVLPHVRAIECRGSAAIDICTVASGNIDAYFINGVKPWDIAAAFLIAEKAGGKISTRSGDPVTVFSSDIVVTNGLLQGSLLQYVGNRTYTPLE